MYFLVKLQDEARKLLGCDLPIRTEHKRKGVIFHGHPAYRQDGEWHDWVLVNWGADGNLSGEIWCFLDLRAILPGKSFKFGSQTIGPGVYAVIGSSYYEDHKNEAFTHGKSRILHPLYKEVVPPGQLEKRQFYLTDVEAFVEPICVVPDVGNDKEEHSKTRYFHVQPRKVWAQNFTKWVKNDHETDHLDDDAEEDAKEAARKEQMEREVKKRKLVQDAVAKMQAEDD